MPAAIQLTCTDGAGRVTHKERGFKSTVEAAHSGLDHVEEDGPTVMAEVSMVDTERGTETAVMAPITEHTLREDLPELPKPQKAKKDKKTK